MIREVIEKWVISSPIAPYRGWSMDIPKSHFCSPTFTYHGEHCNHKMQRIISCCKFSLLSTVNSNKCVIRCKQTDNNQSFLHSNLNLNCRVVYIMKMHTMFLYYTKHAIYSHSVFHVSRIIYVCLFWNRRNIKYCKLYGVNATTGIRSIFTINNFCEVWQQIYTTRKTILSNRDYQSLYAWKHF